MYVTPAAIHGGYEFEPNAKPLAAAIYRSGASRFGIAAQAVNLFKLERRGNRSRRTCNRTEANLERHGRRAETWRFCTATSADNTDTCIPSIACEARQ